MSKSSFVILEPGIANGGGGGGASFGGNGGGAAGYPGGRASGDDQHDRDRKTVADICLLLKALNTLLERGAGDGLTLRLKDTAYPDDLCSRMQLVVHERRTTILPATEKEPTR